MARKLHAIQDAQWPVQFSHVIQAAQPFLAAIIGARLASAIVQSWARCRFHDLDPLSQRSFPRVTLRKSAQLAAGRAFPSGSRVCSGRKCFAGSGNCRRATGSPYASRTRSRPTRHRSNTRESRSSCAETRRAGFCRYPTSARGGLEDGKPA